MNKFNPFIISGYKNATYFCDREKETKLLTGYIKNQVNVSLFAFRRLGKTGLIKHVFASLKKDKGIICIYVDILGTVDKASFVNQLATAIYNAFPKNNSIGKKIIKAIQSLRPVIQFDELTGQPSLTITNISQQQKEKTIASLFQFLDDQNVKIVFAIDEFQQILEYPEKNTEALLRSQMQQLKNTIFIFCGSNQKMMHEIFNSAKRPFFASCTPLYLDYIEKKEYKYFIRKMFKKNKRSIDEDALEFICDWTFLHTFYTQYFSNALYAKNIQHITLNVAYESASEILEINENTFYQYRNLLTHTQWKLLKGIAIREQLFQPNAKKFIAENDLGSPSVVSRAMESLLAKEMIFYNNSVEKPYYEVYNKFLMRWLQSK
jgi:AAA+ ATPase superfamily predicted ATPase